MEVALRVLRVLVVEKINGYALLNHEGHEVHEGFEPAFSGLKTKASALPEVVDVVLIDRIIPWRLFQGPGYNFIKIPGQLFLSGHGFKLFFHHSLPVLIIAFP